MTATAAPADAFAPGTGPSRPAPSRVRQPAPASPFLVLVSEDLADDALNLDQLGSRIVGLGGRIAAATCRWLLLIADFDRRNGYEAFALPNTARWLSYHCGISHRTALDHVRVGRTLAEHPRLAAEMSAGRLSYSHVRAIARIADSPSSQSPPDPAPPVRALPHPAPPDQPSPVRPLPDPAPGSHPAEQFGPTGAGSASRAVPTDDEVDEVHPSSPCTVTPPASTPPDSTPPDSALRLVPDPAGPVPPTTDASLSCGHDLVDSLIDIAEHGTVGQLEEVVRGLRCVDRHEDDDAARRAGVPREPAEYADSRVEWDGYWRLRARLAPELGAVVDAALTAVSHADDVDRATALYRLAEMALASLIDTGRLPRELRGDERTAVVIHLDARDVPPPPAGETPIGIAPTTAADGPAADASPADDNGAHTIPDAAHTATDQPATDRARPDPVDSPGQALQAGGVRSSHPAPGRPLARLAEGPGLPDSVVYRLLCDGRLRTVVYGTDPDGQRRVLDVGRCQRVVTRKQFRALLARDGHACTAPGCGSRRRLHAHHVRHWLHGGLTDPDNMLILCEVHHRKLHDGEFDVQALSPGRFRFVRPDGADLRAHPDPVSLSDANGPVDADHASVGPDAPTTRWDGTRLDRHYAISCLAAARSRLRPAEQPSPRTGISTRPGIPGRVTVPTASPDDGAGPNGTAPEGRTRASAS